jgi:O-acetyl-ADP-ribose deacetylase (regulator of RNase III)
MDDAARIALDAVRQSGTAVRDVRFVLFDAGAYEVFEACL